MMNFKDELIQLLQLPKNSSNSVVFAACLVAIQQLQTKKTKKK